MAMWRRDDDGKISNNLKVAAGGFAFVVTVAICVLVWSVLDTRKQLVDVQRQILPTDSPPLDLMGWAGKAEFDKVVGELEAETPKFQIVGDTRDNAKKVVHLWDAEKALLGELIPTFNQQIGDCVGAGFKQAVERLHCGQMLARPPPEGASYKSIFVPYHYACGRMAPDIGNGKIRGPDGSIGGWQALEGQRYGVIADDAENEDGETLPVYSAQVAKQWANKMPSAAWQKVGKQYLVKTIARVKTADQIRDAVCSGYPVTIASDCGFLMAPRLEGSKLVNRRSGTWQHQMCLGKDTMIPLLDGSKHTIEDLVSMGEVWVYSYDHISGKVVPAKAVAHKTRDEVPEGMVEITLDNGESVETTLDHRFMLRDGEYVEAQSLAVGDSLMPLYKKLSTADDCEHRIGYEMIQDPCDGKWVFTHKRVSEAINLRGLRFVDKKEEFVEAPGSPMCVIHHYDCNKLNNDPSNLLKMLKTEHWRWHASRGSGDVLNKLWQDESFRKMRSEVAREQMIKQRQCSSFAEKVRLAASASMKYRMNNDKEFRDKVTKSSSDRLKLLHKNPVFASECKARAKEISNRPEHKERMRAMCKKFNEDPLNGVKAYQKRVENFRAFLVSEGYDPDTQWDEIRSKMYADGLIVQTTPKYKSWEKYDHKVVSIKRLPEKTGPVYCMSVPGFQNFAVSAGVFVHNCILGYDGLAEGGPYYFILNSWGPKAHGTPKDGSPPGGFWIRKADMDYIAKQDCWALSDAEGFPSRDWQFFEGRPVGWVAKPKDAIVAAAMQGEAFKICATFAFALAP